MAAMQRQRIGCGCRRVTGVKPGYGRRASGLVRSLIEIDALLELPLDVPVELEVSRDVELPPELLGMPQREARTRSQWRLPPVSPLMMRNTRLMMNARSCLAYVGTCICVSFGKINATLNRLRGGF